jgi:NADH-quinone oxidoreductase subunit L
VLVAMLTTFYMFRLVFVVFYGAAKSDHAERAHETSPVMTWPLRILAVFSSIGGVIGIEQIFHGQFTGEAGEHAATFAQKLFSPFTHSPIAATCGLLAVAIGFAVAYALYAKAATDPLPAKLGAFSRAMRNRFYFDEIYEATVIRLHNALAAIADWFDRWIISGACIGLIRGGTDFTGRALRLIQTGNLQTYAFLFVLGVALVLYLVLGK